MAKRVTDEDILFINNVYYACKNKAETARQTGWSAGTVTKYLIPDFAPDQMEFKKSTVEPVELPRLDPNIFQQENWNELTILTEAELVEMIELRKELII